jgi:dihydroxyacid dehydratase/phosphogluconate dehydratase
MEYEDATVNQLRSADWYEGADRNAYIHRAWMRRGLPNEALDSTKPQIAIANTASDLTPCNMHLNEVADSVKQGIWAAGGVPYNLPVVSLGETQVKPTAMLWRNMAAMAMEEMFRANPIDGLVLLGGCDKTIPALLMAAASVNLPAVVVPGGPMLTGHFRGEALGCGTDVWRLSEEARAGKITNDPLQRPLQHHGHRLHNGGGSGSARHDHPGVRGHSRARRTPALDVPRHGTTDCGHGRAEP